MLLNNRHGSVDSDAYRYGFQGQERDDEVKGEGNSYNYTYRMHDPRIGRFFAVDPLHHKYSFYSPYQFGANQVIHSVEFEGLETINNLNPTEHVVFNHHDTGIVLGSDEDARAGFLVGLGDFFVNIWDYGVEAWQTNGASVLVDAIQLKNGIELTFNYIVTNNPDQSDGVMPGEVASNTGQIAKEIVEAEKQKILSYVLNAGNVNEGLAQYTGKNSVPLAIEVIGSKGGLKGFNILFKIDKAVPDELARISSSITSLSDIERATDFIRDSGVVNVQGHLDAMFPGTSSVEMLPQGTKLYRFSLKNTKDAKHYFSTESDILPGDVGLYGSMSKNPSNYIMEEFILESPVQVLKSRVNNITEPGATQVFSPQIEGASSSTIIKTFGN